MASATPGLSYEIGAVFVVAFVVLGALYALNRYLKRRGPELATREGRGVLADRSYNQIRIGEAAAGRLARSGTDVTAAKMLLARAETARASGSFDMAIDLAKKAQDLLVVTRSGAQTLVVAPSSQPESRTAVDAASRGSALISSTSVPAPRSSSTSEAPLDPRFGTSDFSPSPVVNPSNRPPKNKMEAHFQLSLAAEELEHLRTTQPPAKNLPEANQLRSDGQAAYDRQEFTEALRLALRSRRALGTRVEGLPVATVPNISAVSTNSEDSSGTSPRSASASKEPAFGPKCPRCGKAAAADDRFCRSCGGPIPPTFCVQCATPLLAGDRFCGACGAVQP